MARYANVTPLATQTVTLLVKHNPKRPGSAAHARFAKYKNGATVAQLVKAGVTIADIKWDLAHKFVQLNGTGKPSAPVTVAKPANTKGKPANTGKPAPAAPASTPAAPASTAPAK